MAASAIEAQLSGIDPGLGLGTLGPELDRELDVLRHVKPRGLYTVTGPGQDDDRTGNLAKPGGGLQALHPHESRRVRRAGEVVVVLPALNEEGGVGRVIDRIPKAELQRRGYRVSVWVVDGKSTDRTLEVARDRGASTFIQDGKGKGNGMRQALDYLLALPAPGIDHRFFVMLDADGTYPEGDIVRFVEALESGDEVVLGSRLRGPIEDGAISSLNLLGNRILSALASLLYRVSVSDVCTGMWGFHENALRAFGLVADGFDLEADLFAAACEQKVRLRELAIVYHRRIGEAKLIPLRTGVVIALRLLLRRLSQHRSAPPMRTRPAPARALEEAA